MRKTDTFLKNWSLKTEIKLTIREVNFRKQEKQFDFILTAIQKVKLYFSLVELILEKKPIIEISKKNLTEKDKPISIKSLIRKLSP